MSMHVLFSVQGNTESNVFDDDFDPFSNTSTAANGWKNAEMTPATTTSDPEHPENDQQPQQQQWDDQFAELLGGFESNAASGDASDVRDNAAVDDRSSSPAAVDASYQFPGDSDTVHWKAEEGQVVTDTKSDEV